MDTRDWANAKKKERQLKKLKRGQNMLNQAEKEKEEKRKFWGDRNKNRKKDRQSSKKIETRKDEHERKEGKEKERKSRRKREGATIKKVIKRREI